MHASATKSVPITYMNELLSKVYPCVTYDLEQRMSHRKVESYKANDIVVSKLHTIKYTADIVVV